MTREVTSLTQPICSIARTGTPNAINNSSLRHIILSKGGNIGSAETWVEVRLSVTMFSFNNYWAHILTLVKLKPNCRINVGNYMAENAQEDFRRL